jgi:hypothetical protein
MKSEYIKPVAEVVKFQPAEEITTGLNIEDYLSLGFSGGLWIDEEE